MTRLLLVRHAECASLVCRDDEPVIADEDNVLTDRGRAAAIALGAQLRERLRTARVIASPLPRARATAAAIAEVLATSCEDEPRIAERRFGFPAETTSAESRLLQIRGFRDPELRHGNGETVREHRARVETWWRATEPTLVGTVVVVSHGGTIDHLMAILFGAPLAAAAAMFVRLDPCAHHAWTLLEPTAGMRVWRLDGTNLVV